MKKKRDELVSKSCICQVRLPAEISDAMLEDCFKKKFMNEMLPGSLLLRKYRIVELLRKTIEVERERFGKFD